MANYQRDTGSATISKLSSFQNGRSEISPTPLIGVPQIVIVGAGMSGLVTAMFLARKGFQVDVFEKRAELSSCAPDSGRSMNLTLCERGLSSLEELGIRNHILSKSVKLAGRAIHRPSGQISLQNYGDTEKNVLYAIRRYDLNTILIEESIRYPNIRIHYSNACISLDKQQKSVHFLDSSTSGEVVKKYDLLVGADGVFSEVRTLMQEKEMANYTQRFSEWGYKEISIYPGQSKKHNLLSRDRLHVWARKNALLIGIPNNDGSFTCNLFLPLKGKDGFENIVTPTQTQQYFQSYFADFANLVPDLELQYLSNRVNGMVSIQTSLWHFEDSIVLVGDASHGIFPFLGQGVNSAFEDCSTLNECLNLEPKDWQEALAKYQRLRKSNAEALASLVDEHFLDLKKNITSVLFFIQSTTQKLLSLLTFGAFQSIYSLISHTTIPYLEILKKRKLRSTYILLLFTLTISTLSVLILTSLFQYGRLL